MCPKTHLLVYMKLANINDNLSNYIFQLVVKNKSGCKLHKSRKLSYTRAREILLGNLEKVGLPKGCFGLYSLRSGGATAAGNVVPEESDPKTWQMEGRELKKKTGTYTSFISEMLLTNMIKEYIYIFIYGC